MGCAKSQMMEYEERGYGNSDKVVCQRCVGDHFLKTIIKDAENKNVCNFCGTHDYVVELEELMERIFDGIVLKYSKAVEELGYDSSEGGYLGETWDTYDILYDDIAFEAEIDDSALLKELYSMLNEDIWCERVFMLSRSDLA